MMTVSELIKLLRSFPKDTPVTGYNGREETEFVSTDGVRLVHADGKNDVGLRNDDGTPYVGPYVDIMGF